MPNAELDELDVALLEPDATSGVRLVLGSLRPFVSAVFGGVIAGKDVDPIEPAAATAQTALR